MSSNLKVNTILPSTGTTVAVSGIASVTSSVSIASSCTATTFYGSGANLTSLPSQLTINNATANRVLTSDGGTTLNGEANLTFNGNSLLVNNTSSNTAAHFKGAGGAGFIQITDSADSSTAFIGVDGGTLKFQTSGSSYSDKLTINSSGDVNINGNLTVSSGTSGDAKLIIEADTDNNDEGDNPTLVFKQDGGIEVSAIGHGLLSGDQNGLVLANSCSNGYMSFATGSTNGHTNATERLRIDSSGNVTKPSHCCFQAVINSGTHPTSGSYIVFGAVDVNIGNNYNSSNGIFTAPVAGVYLFHISAIAHNNATTVYRYFLRINNGNTGSGNDAHLRLDMNNDDADFAPNASYTYYKYMNVNDTARVYWYTDAGSGTSYSNADYMKFAGHLIG